MNIEDIKLKFLAGMPVEIEDCGSIYIPKVKEVISIGESLFNEYLSILLMDKANFDEEFHENVTNFQILYSNCFHSPEFKKKCLDAIKFIFKKEAQMSDYENTSYAFFYFEDGIIHRENFESIQEIIRIGNHINKPVRQEDEFRPAGAAVAKYIKEMFEERRKKQKPKEKETMNLHSLISALSWKSGTPNIESILELTNYQFYDGFKRLEKIDNVHYTLVGIYTGNVDVKKINTNELNFAKIIEIKELE